ncbi:MAG: hypothetical protein MJE77_09770 [Proteobacteria bacterium]|nr:hypothetical protein [Pseudomonadota bacterium]
MSHAPREPYRHIDLLASLEKLRNRLIALEAMAHAASDTVELLPYLTRLSRHPQLESRPAWTETQCRNIGRLQSLVVATASSAYEVLHEIDSLLHELAETKPLETDTPDSIKS